MPLPPPRGDNGWTGSPGLSDPFSQLPVRSDEPQLAAWPSQSAGPWSTFAPPPVYQSSGPLPVERPFRGYMQSHKRRWGLRFVFVLVVAGVGAHFARPYVPWVDARLGPIEDTAK